MISYLLDANVFIQAKNFLYPLDVFPGFWDWLKRSMESGLLGSIIPVYDELTKGNDELADWISQFKDSGCFLCVDDTDTQKKYSEIASWVVDPAQGFKQTACEEFFRVADSWLIAKAFSINAIVVTHEKLNLNSIRKVYIPNVCRAFGIEYINILELIRKTGVKFEVR